MGKDRKERRWQHQAECCNDITASSALASEQNASRGADAPQVVKTLASGEAYFPMMTQREVDAIAVPATAPADNVRCCLAEHGVCLVTGVLSPQECFEFEGLWQTDLLNVMNVTRGAAEEDKISAAAVERVRDEGVGAWPQAWSAGIGKKGSVSQRGLPHGAFAWNARMCKDVRKVFSDIFDVPQDDLAVGLDCVFWSGADSPAAESNKQWLHCDQNHRTGMTWPCIQGVLYVWPSESERASTTVVWPGSHREVYRRMMDDSSAYERGKKGGQSLLLSQLSDNRLREEMSSRAIACSRRVPCPAGSLLLWDSRTIHQGWSGGPRLAQPVSWEPRQRREQDPHALSRKIIMCAMGVPSSHSSAEARVHGMAPRACNSETKSSAGCPALRAQILPHCVADKEEVKWEEAHKFLWDMRENPARALASTLPAKWRQRQCDAIHALALETTSLLKSEIVAAL